MSAAAPEDERAAIAPAGPRAPGPGGLRRRIWVAFILQMTAVSFATVIGIYAAATVVENVLIKHVLERESAHFFQRIARDPAALPPDTYFVRGFFAAHGRETAIPPDFAGLGPGFHHAHDAGTDLVYVSDAPAGRLYLALNEMRMHRIALIFGSVLCGVIIIIVYLATWMTYRASRRALSPVIALANTVRDWDPGRPDIDALLPENLPVRADGDVESLALALYGFATRLEEFVERERAFTRDASHELRTPLTVIKGSADMLLDDEVPPFAQRAANRILRSVRDMESLIESFLILARESDGGLPEEIFSLNDAVREEIERAQSLVDDKPVELALDERAEVLLDSSPRAFGILIGNLIRNACLYTEQGSVTVTIDADGVTVRDTGVGMSEDVLARAFVSFFRGDQGRGSGHGIGLAIVRRLADRYGWEVTMASREGVGTTVHVSFPDAQRADAAGPA